MVKLASPTTFADATMRIEQVDFLPLQPIRVRSNGKRDYDPVAKQRLIQMCVSSGASVSSMALKAGVNANQLRKWIGQSRQAAECQGCVDAVRCCSALRGGQHAE